MGGEEMGERKDSLYTNQFTHAHICYPFLKPYLKKSILSANLYYMTLALLCWVPLIGPVPQIHFIRPLATTPGSIIAFTGSKLPSNPLDIEAVYSWQWVVQHHGSIHQSSLRQLCAGRPHLDPMQS